MQFREWLCRQEKAGDVPGSQENSSSTLTESHGESLAGNITEEEASAAATALDQADLEGDTSKESSSSSTLTDDTQGKTDGTPVFAEEVVLANEEPPTKKQKENTIPFEDI